MRAPHRDRRAISCRDARRRHWPSLAPASWQSLGAIAVALALAALPRVAQAQPAPGDPPAQAQPTPQAPPGEAAAATPEEAKKRAEEHFARGLGFYEKSAWDPALAEFLASRTLYPTRSATKNAALCLRALSRYDEALDMFEALLREFPDLSEGDRAAAQQSVSELSGMVGSVELRGVPIGASVTVDARAVSSTVTAGRVTERVSAGARIVRVFKDGFAPFEARPVVLAGRTVVVQVELQALRRLADGTWGKDPLADLAPKPLPPPPSPPGRVVIELDVAGALTSSMGGVVDGASGIGAGGLAALHAGYELASGIGFGITLGGLMVSQSYDERALSVTPKGEATLPGTVDESLRLRGALLGGHGGLHLGDRFPGLIRLGVGALVGSAADERSGTFADASARRYQSGVISDSDAATFLYIAPEARFGYRFAKRFEVSAGIAGYVLVRLRRARWDNEQLFPAGGRGGAALLPAEELTGSVFVVLAPGAGLRADF